MKLRPGHNLYGLAAIAFAIITLVWHQISALGNMSHPEILVYIVAIIEIIGGLAMQWQPAMKFGALALGAVYIIFTLYLVQFIIDSPLEYSNWGNLFEQLSVALGAVFVLASTITNPKRATRITRITYMCYGICVASYSLYQFFYLPYTANLVPKWIPPGQMFWAVATSIAFGLAAVSILTRRFALLAARLLAIMFICFCLLVWLPLCIKDPHNMTYWFSNTQTLAVAGTAWIVSDFLNHSKSIY